MHSQWYDMKVLRGARCHKIGIACHVYWNSERKVYTAVRGDDVLSVFQHNQQLDWLRTLLNTHLDFTAEPSAGPAKLGGVSSGSFLKRQIQWTEKGVAWNADAQHARKIAKTVLPRQGNTNE